MKTVKFNSIADIQAHTFYGNHHHDAEAFRQIDAFVADENHSTADRAEAIRIMCDKGMGMGRQEETSDDDLIRDHLTDES